MMGKLLTAAVLTLSLLFTPAGSDPPSEDGTPTPSPPHECGGVVFDTPLSGELSRSLESGSYYLTGDCRLCNRVMIAGEVNICLNGYRIDAHNATTLQVNRGGVLSVYDCSGESLIGYVGGTDHNHPVTVDPGGIFNLYGGRLYAKNGSNAVNSKGTVNIYGGVVESGDPGHCAVRNDHVLNLYGGVLRGSLGVSQRGSGEVHICGDSVLIDAGQCAIQYVSQTRPVYVDTPAYLWRTDPEGEFISSCDRPCVVTGKGAYLELAPAGPRVVSPPAR